MVLSKEGGPLKDMAILKGATGGKPSFSVEFSEEDSGWFEMAGECW